MDPKIERAYRKANAMAVALQVTRGKMPTKKTVILALCPPQAETKCGDSWPGPDGVLQTQDDERNWGATTFRSLNAAESAAVNAAGIVPTVGADHTARAAAAMAAIKAAGLPVASGSLRGITVPRATIHCDSRTEIQGGRKVQVPYFVWFANFDSDEEAARYYLTFMPLDVLENPASSVTTVAAAMYGKRYFAGFHPHQVYTHPGPDKVLGTADDEQRDGNQENVNDYAAWLSPHYATWTALLKDWEPSQAFGGAPPVVPVPPVPPAPPKAEVFNLNTTIGVQRALNAIGCGRTAKGPLETTSGVWGPLSTACLGFFEGAARYGDRDDLIPITGQFPLTPATREALTSDLKFFGFEVV